MALDLALLGMMGVGKSTVARALAERLHRPVVATDAGVEQAAGRSIPDVFAEDGEAAFRAFERDVVGVLGAGGRPQVVDLGGGAVLDDRNVDALRRHAVLIELRAPVPVLAARLSQEALDRPLLFGTDLAQRLGELVEERGARYAAVADHVVDADRAVGEVVDDILAWAAERGDVLTPSESAEVLARLDASGEAAP